MIVFASQACACAFHLALHWYFRDIFYGRRWFRDIDRRYALALALISLWLASAEARAAADYDKITFVMLQASFRAPDKSRFSTRWYRQAASPSRTVSCIGRFYRAMADTHLSEFWRFILLSPGVDTPRWRYNYFNLLCRRRDDGFISFAAAFLPFHFLLISGKTLLWCRHSAFIL